MTSSKAAVLLVALVIVIAIAAALFPATPQPQSYHHFADQRSWLGIPNFGDVASNLGFTIVGAWGLIALLRRGPGAISFTDPRERWFYELIFLGMFLTAFGSSYYHFAPDNARLVWDRLPMTIVFMSLVAAVIAERVSVNAGVRLWPALLATGIASVLVWRASELRGNGDLRFYAAVQAGSILILLLALFLPARYTRGSDFAVVVGFYVLAKILETADRKVFAIGQIVSGHTLKHLAAAAAGYWVLRMLERRKPIL
jgi:hypothetical protein